MSQFLPWLAGIPLIAFLIVFIIPRNQEKTLSGLVLGSLAVQVLLAILLVIWWYHEGMPDLYLRLFTIYRSEGFEFFISLMFDRLTAVFVIVGGLLVWLVSLFSRFYMHRDPGFSRFFGTLLLFYIGYNLIVLAGNFETLFIGWEILGITSFLLIAYYRDRYLPVRNALKVLSFYRLGDICLILAMWLCHHLWHKNITFEALNAGLTVFEQEYAAAWLIALLIVVAAAIKSAQLPFSSWLPRAMEGPTTSSAVFYGALSAHIGVFLLLRTHSFWSHELWIRGLVLALGAATALVTTGIARVQSTVKTQIAYASITQIGLMLVEIALGWHTLALVHFVGNAFLRTYQLLVSPSVLNYLIHDMFFHFKPGPKLHAGVWRWRINRAYYLLNVQEWRLDHLFFHYLWSPFKWLGRRLFFLRGKTGFGFGAFALLIGAAAVTTKTTLDTAVLTGLTLLFATLALLQVLYALAERDDALSVWFHAIASQWFVTVAIMLNSSVPVAQLGYYLGGSTVAAFLGYLSLRYLQKREGSLDLHRQHGHVYEYRKLAMTFLICCLGVSGFPVSPTFIGIDLVFTHVHIHQVLLVVLLAVNVLFLELALLRMYVRVFLGQHQKEYHEIAYRSS